MQRGTLELIGVLASISACGCASSACPPSRTSDDAHRVTSEAAVVPSPTSAVHEDANLVGFSLAHCLSLYFEKQGWSPESARNIAGGYVETGTKPAETYEQLAAVISNYHPPLQTKQEIDIDLLRCFHLNESAEWRELVKP